MDENERRTNESKGVISSDGEMVSLNNWRRSIPRIFAYMLLLGKRACVGTGDYDVFLDHIHSWNKLVTDDNRYVSPCVRRKNNPAVSRASLLQFCFLLAKLVLQVQMIG